MNEHPAKFYLRRPGGGYDLILKRGSLDNLRHFTETVHRRVLIVTGAHTPADYAETALRQCAQGQVLRLSAGDGARSLTAAEQVLHALCAMNAGRYDAVIGLGGGSVLGTAGVAAGLYLGGIDFIACPTTVCAQLCACGNDTLQTELPGGYGAGVPNAPALVLTDPALTESMSPTRQLTGLAWALPPALTYDPPLLALLEASELAYDEILWKTLQDKKDLTDRYPNGCIAELMPGAPLVRALWQLYGRRGRRSKGLLPEECLALAVQAVIEDKALARRVRALCRRLGLPARAVWSRERALPFLLKDPSCENHELPLVLITGSGCWRRDRLTEQALSRRLGCAAVPEEKE